jgi:hypothetical protein
MTVSQMFEISCYAHTDQCKTGRLAAHKLQGGNYAIYAAERRRVSVRPFRKICG